MKIEFRVLRVFLKCKLALFYLVLCNNNRFNSYFTLLLLSDPGVTNVANYERAHERCAKSAWLDQRLAQARGCSKGISTAVEPHRGGAKDSPYTKHR